MREFKRARKAKKVLQCAFTIVFLLVWVNGNATIKTKHVLFIGNSLTYYNNMPQTIQKMCDAQKLNIKIDQQTFAGAMLCEHACYVIDKDFQRHRAEKGEVPNGVKKILNQKWDYVILQDAGSKVLNPKYAELSFEPSLIFLDSLIKRVHAKTILFEDYAGQEYPRQICFSKMSLNLYMTVVPISSVSNYHDLEGDYCSIYIKKSDDEYAIIKAEFEKISRKINSGLVKVGYAFYTFKSQHPTIPIYQSHSDNHPSLQGSYLIACLFYKNITGNSLKNTKYSAGLNNKQAQIIRDFADGIK